MNSLLESKAMAKALRLSLAERNMGSVMAVRSHGASAPILHRCRKIST